MATQTTGSTADLELEGLRASIAADPRGDLADLERLVNIDCGSYTPEGVNEVGRWTARFLEDLGADIDVRPDSTGRFADTIVATFERKADGPRVLLIGHMDTVFDPGTAAARPFRIDDDTARGPGVTDMKSGLLAGLYALKAIISELGGLPFGRLTFIANPDEEVGSPSSREHIRAAAADVDACLVLECARANGDIVSARKGILDTRLTVHGRAAHAGVEPEKGRSAIMEAARIVRGLHDHPFTGCFVCGTARAEGDGLRLRPGLFAAGLTACVWTPHPASSRSGTIRTASPGCADSRTSMRGRSPMRPSTTGRCGASTGAR